MKKLEKTVKSHSSTSVREHHPKTMSFLFVNNKIFMAINEIQFGRVWITLHKLNESIAIYLYIYI